jgi:two-component system phosphate regulon sensor histidine kinase PhoR
MNNALVIGLVICLGIAAWLAWRLLNLRRGIQHLAEQVRQGQEASENLSALGGLASAINARQNTLQEQNAATQAEQSRLSAILDQLTDGVLIADADGRVQFANPAAEKLFDGALSGLSVTEVLRHHSLVEAWRECRATNEPRIETVELPASGQFLQLVVIPDRDMPGGTLLLAQDLTRVRRLETVRHDFISNLSHELRTPLASLKALTETLLEGAYTDPQAGPRFLGQIQTEVDALTQMAQELLDLSKIESGQVTLNLHKVEPGALLKTVAERMHLQAERAGVTLEVETTDSPSIQADAGRLEQVLVNLVHNAVKFTGRGGKVTLSAKADDGSVIFAVRDTGIGIPADDLPRIFERFYRVDKSRAGSGTGLGLSISKHIVEAHGGSLQVKSRQGEGSVFLFSIPIRRT